MAIKQFDLRDRQFIIHTDGQICASKKELLLSSGFERILTNFIDSLAEVGSPLLDEIGFEVKSSAGRGQLMNIFDMLGDESIEAVVEKKPEFSHLLDEPHRGQMLEFVEELYNYWRSFDRFMVLHSEPGPSSFDRRPYRAFNETIEMFGHLIRSTYRDICENLSGDHPRIYRQVSAGCNIGLIGVTKPTSLPKVYEDVLKNVPFIRQTWITPPMIIDPPMNKRTGRFERIETNPLEGLRLSGKEYLCYPACVGPLLIFVYFHVKFIGLGCTLANLFEMATDEQIAHGPDAVFVYGAPSEHMAQFGDLPTVFYDDEENSLLAAAVPAEERFGYFGYIKKMMLTLHNIAMIKQGRMPFHGAMVRLLLPNHIAKNVLIIGDTATGKSESLEAFRILGMDVIEQLRIIADDMGSLDVDSDGRVIGYGTEIGAFIRLDDLQQGYAFGQIDRAIIMSPHKVNARVVIPVTTIKEVLTGHPVDFLLYANNYEETDEDHPILERFTTPEQALEVFRQGSAMAKGTTTSTGLVHSYFANIFGPPQYRDMHEPLAQKLFRAAFDANVFVGQLRTRLGISGYESKGPEQAAGALLDTIIREK